MATSSFFNIIIFERRLRNSTNHHTNCKAISPPSTFGEWPPSVPRQNSTASGDSSLVIMSSQNRSLASTTRWSFCMPIRAAAPLYTPISGLGTAMSEDPGVQFMGARSKVSQETLRGTRGKCEGNDGFIDHSCLCFVAKSASHVTRV